MQSRVALIVLVSASFACGRDPLGRALRDATSSADSAESRDVLPFREAAGEPGPDLSNELGPEVAGEHGPEIRRDACISLTCRDPGCFPSYCGEIGDGCGGSIDCGACETGWSCKRGLCYQDLCVPIVCAAKKPICNRQHHEIA
jgi:hypothetical protein